MKLFYLFIGCMLLSFGTQAQNRYTKTIVDETDSSIIEQVIYQDSIAIESTHYIYKYSGELAVTVKYSYREDGVVDTRTLENFNNNQLTSRWQYSPDEYLLMEEHRKYDRQGRLVNRKQTFYDGAYQDNIVEKRKYKGDICKVTIYLNDELKHEYTDKNGK